MAVGTGIGFDYSKLIDAFNELDAKLKSLTTEGKNFGDTMKHVFANMAKGDFDDFVKKVGSLKTDILAFGKQKVGLQWDSKGLQEYINDVNRLILVIKEIQKNKGTTALKGTGVNIQGLRKEVKDAQELLRIVKQVEKEMARKTTSKNQSYTGALAYSANAKTIEQERQAIQNLTVARERLKQTDADYASKLQTLNAAIDKHRASIAQAEAPLSARINTMKQLQDEYLRLSSIVDRLSKDPASSIAGSAAQAQLNNYRTQLAAAGTEMRNYAAANADAAAAAQQSFNTKQLDEAAKKEKMLAEETKRRAEEAKKAAEEQARYDSISRRERYKAYTTSYEGAIRTSDKAKTLAQEIQAVKNLEAARAKLIKTDSDYQKKLDELNKRIRTHNENIKTATAGTKELESAHSKLGSKIATVFSAQAIVGYVNKMIKVRGEMELQQRSLQAILQDKDKANEVWQKTIDLAVKSPFRINQLVNYTKQLAAYRIEADKLYDTNKMLADVSAGLGVDMQRLILAFGQVKAANFLRGTELRQFTEAGIPMLDELAKLYRDMGEEGVTAADVFDRISKRMVLFEDVEKVFERMTSASGTFYRMQEIQSETLKGQISNLKDSIDIMLNDMGKANDGILKFSVKTVKLLVDNYESLIPVLKALIAYLALYKISAFKASEATIIYAKSINMTKVSAAGLGGMWTSLRASLHKFGASMGNTLKMLSANPWILLATAVVASVTAFVKYRNELKKVNKEYAELRNRQAEITAKYYKTTDLDKQKEALKELIEYAEKEYSIEVEVDIKSMSREEVKRKMNELRQQLLEANAFGVTFQQELIRANAHTKWDDFGTRGIFEQGLFKDIDEMGNAYDELNTLLLDSLHPTIDMLANKWGNLSEEQKESLQMQLAALQSLKHGIGDWEDEDEDMVEYFDRLRKNFQLLVDSGDITDRKLKRALKAYRRDYDEAVAEFEVFAKRIDETVNAIESDEDKTIRLNAAIDDAKFEREWSVFEETVIRRLLSKRYSINLVPQIEEDDDSLKAWQESYMRKFAGKAGYRPIEDEGTSQAQVIERLQGTYQSLEEQIKRIKKAGKDSVLTGGAYEGEPIEQLERQLKEVKAQLDWFGASTKKGGGGSGKDVVMERLKNRINLIKEMNKEYEKLRKTFSDVDAIKKVKEAYEATAKELGLDASTMDFTDAGTIKSLEDLLGKPEYAANKYVLELQKALDNFKVELGITTKQADDERLKDDIQKLFDQYDLTLELKKLNMPPELAKSLFDVDYLDLEGLKRAVQAQSAKFIGTDMEKDYKDFLKKIDELERKALIDRTKTYLEYAKLAIGERAKIKLEELQKLKEIEETFAIKEGDSEETQAYKKDMRERASSRVREEAEAALKNLEWDEFQKTETFTSLFADIDDASDALINHMIKKIREFKDEWKDMPLEDVRTMVNKLNELESALAERSPWEAYRKAKAAVKKAREDAMFSFESEEARDLYGKGRSDRDYIAAVQVENAYQEEKAANAEREAAAIESILALKTKEREGSVVDLGLSREQMKYVELTEEQLRDLLTIKKGEASTARAVVLSNGQILVQYKNQEKSLLKQKETLGEVQNMANDLYEAFTELAEALGADSESPAAIFADMGMNMMNAVLNTMMLQAQLKAVEVGAYAAGTALNAAMGVIGWIVMGVQLLTQAITAIAKARDNQIVAQLEEQAEIIERQRDLYEQIEKKVENAYNVDNLREYNAEMKRSVELEIQALEASIALEKSRKNVDEEQVKDYENQIAEARERLTESTQGMMEELNGIFDLSDFTSGFIDAWWDAMDEGKKGLDALNEHFNETMKDMAKKQALYRGAQEIMSQVQEAINKSLEGDFTVDEAEWQAIMNAAKQANVNLDEFLQGWYDMFGAMSDSAGGGLSALQKGIQGITEDTAQIIEAYLNSIRGYVSEQVTHTKNIYRILNDAVHSDAAAIRVRMV